MTYTITNPGVYIISADCCCLAASGGQTYYNSTLFQGSDAIANQRLQNHEQGQATLGSALSMTQTIVAAAGDTIRWNIGEASGNASSTIYDIFYSIQQVA